MNSEPSVPGRNFGALFHHSLIQALESLSKPIFLLLSLGIFTYLVMRAIFVPLVHDEAETFFIYFVNGHYLPYQGWESANNHFLNSFLGHLCFKWIGPWNWSIRIPNLVFFPLYALYLYLISRRIRHDLIRWSLILSMLSVTLLIEFFALARGYGMGMAFFLAYLFHFTAYLKDGSDRDFQLTAFFGLFMLLASLTTFYVFVLVTFLLLTDHFYNHAKAWKRLFILLLFNVFPLLFFVRYTLHLGEINELVVGTLSGMYTETIAPMAYWLFGSDHPAIVSSFFIALAIIGIDLIQYLRSSLSFKALINSRITFQLLLTGSLCIIAVNGYLLDIPFPRDRAALFLIPLLLISFAFSLDDSSLRPAPYLAIPMLFFPLHFLAKANFSHSHYWKTKHLDPAFYDLIAAGSGNEVMTIGSMSLRESIWYHQVFTHDNKLNPMYIEDPKGNLQTDFIIQPDSINKDIGQYYTCVRRDEISGNNLYERVEKLKRQLVKEGKLAEYRGNDLYRDILIQKVDSNLFDQQVLLELDMHILSEEVPKEFSLVMKTTNSVGDVLRSQSVRLSRLKYRWDLPENTKLLLNLGRMEKGVDELKAFILNGDGKPYQVQGGSFKFHILVHQ